MRAAGILMPVTSLPSPYGIGTIGQEARDFITFLHSSGQTYWQILPICPTGYGDSPYQSFSSFAGNPYLIDLDDLASEGLLKPEEYQNINWGSCETRVDYGLLYQKRFGVLEKACKRIPDVCADDFSIFCEKQAYWLTDYAMYMAVKEMHGGAALSSWEDRYRLRDEGTMKTFKEEHVSEIAYWMGIQFLFFRQWDRLKSYAKEQGIRIIGDIPIYISGDSADVWAHPEQFQLDDNLVPTEVAGCPPDGFSATGQLWGNPLFDWEFMKNDGYHWWIRRIEYQAQIYDVIRIDHFRGFDEYYAIPYGDTTAMNGRWRPGPGIGFFRKIEETLGRLPIIAEDLGFLTPSVKQLLKESGFPGMKVLEFAFDSRDTGFGYKPHLYDHNCIVYTGTHDNETVLGWFDTAIPEDAEKAAAYFRLNREEGYNRGFIRAAWASVSDTAIIPLPDLLGLGHEGRINTPSTLGNNWTWRCRKGDYNDTFAAELLREMKLYERERRD